MKTSDTLLDITLAQKADRTLRRCGSSLNGLMNIVTSDSTVLPALLKDADLEFNSADDAIAYLHTLV